MSHHDHPDHHRDEADMFTQEFWDERYAGSTRVWSGKPNQRLVEQVSGLTPGRALDVGCGEGADVVWLAQQGWLAAGVDVSQVALDRAAQHAEALGVGERTTWRRVDVLGGSPLPGGMDLVAASYLHPPLTLFAQTYDAVAGAVRAGGTLLVVGHHPADSSTGLRNPALAHLLFTPEQVLARLAADAWEVAVAEGQTRETANGTATRSPSRTRWCAPCADDLPAHGSLRTRAPTLPDRRRGGRSAPGHRARPDGVRRRRGRPRDPRRRPRAG